MSKNIHNAVKVLSEHIEIYLQKRDGCIELESAKTCKIDPELCETVDLEEESHDEARCFISLLKVKISDTSKISSLTLSHCGLTDLPDCFNMLRIKKLDVSFNQLKVAPFCLLSGLKMLEELDVSHNSIFNFDIEPKCTKRLRVLNLHRNKFSHIPTWILSKHCEELQVITYSGNKLGVTDRACVHNNIHTLRIEDCHLQQIHLSVIKTIQNLQYLHMGNSLTSDTKNSFIDIDYLFLKPSWQPSILVLDLSNLGLSYLPEELKLLLKLQELHVQGNSLTWLPESITHLAHLETLDISRNKIAYLPHDIYNLNELKTLLAAFNSIYCVPKLGQSVSKLDLYWNDIEEVCYEDLCPIAYIDLEKNRFEVTKIDNYSDKKKNLRLLLHDGIERFDGVLMDNSENIILSDSNNMEYENNDPMNYNDTSEQDESWVTEKVRTNAEITTSDDEWMGVEKKRICQRKRRRNFDNRAPNLYIDAD